MDASSSVRDSSSRRRGTMRKSGSGVGDARRRRRASGDRNSMKQDASTSLADNSSGYTTAPARGRGSMDISGYSTSMRGSSQRRVAKENTLGNSSGDLSVATSTTGMVDSASSGMNRHVQKYRTAQEQLQQHQSSKKPEKRHSRRRHSSAQGIPSSSSGDVGSKSPISSRDKRSLSSKYKLISRVAAGATDAVAAPKTPKSRRRRSIGAENSTEETLATSSGGSSNSGRNQEQPQQQQQKQRPKRRSSLPGKTNTNSSAIPPRSNSRTNRNQKSGSNSDLGTPKTNTTGTATRATPKRAFSIDSASTSSVGAAALAKAPPPSGVRKKSPIRSVKRNISMPAGKKGNQQLRSRTDRRPSGGSRLLGTRSHSGDRESSQRRASVAGAATAGQDIEQKQRRRRPSKDMASRTTWDTPKSKPKFSSAAILMFGGNHKKTSGSISMDDSSMPSLAALDLSIHTGKRYSADSSTIVTTTTNATDTIASAPNQGNSMVGRKPLPPNALLKAKSYSLLVDNATSHHVPLSPRRGGDDDGSTTIDDSDVNDGDTYDGGDIYSAASIDQGTVATATTTTSSTMRDGSSLMAADLSRSDVSRRSDENESRASGGRRRRMMVDGSRKMDGSRMDRSEARRRAKSCDGSNGAPKTPRSSRKSPGRSAARPRRNSRGLSSSGRRGSSGSLGRSRSRSGEPKAASRRRASMSASVRSSSRDRGYSRERSSSSLEQKRARAAVVAAANTGSGAIRRSQTTTAIPERQKSSNSLKSKNSAEPPSPRRQRGASSVLANKNKSPAKRKKTKKKISKLPDNLSQIETMWVRGSGDKAEMQAAASEVVANIPEGAINVQPQQRNRKSSNMSVGAASMGSSSRKGVGSSRLLPRQNSNGAASIASRGSSDSRKGRRPSKSRPRVSDTSWSLADIDLGEDMPGATPPIVASKSSDDKMFAETSRGKRENFRRVKSLGSRDGLQGKSRQASQKIIASNPQQPSTPEGNLRVTSDKSVASAQDPFTMKADEIDPFGSQHGEQFRNDVFSSNPLPDPFQAPKPQQFGKASTEKPGYKKGDPLGPSFHLTDDFGDFGDASFANYDGSDDGCIGG